MSAEELLRDGKLDECLQTLQAEVRKAPADAKLRVFLFQLMCVLGQWERAVNQLKVAGGIDPATLPMVQAYREAVRCELLRAEVFAGLRTPLLFGDPAEWVALLLEALQLGATGEVAKSQDARGRAFELAPGTTGRVNGTPFEWMADADPRLGPVTELIVNGRYYWVPFARIRRIDFEPPNDLRDVVWAPANFTWANGGEAVGFMPTRYPGTVESGDFGLMLSRRTEWTDCGSELFTGLGQRLLATDVDEYALMDLRSIELDSEDDSPAEDPSQESGPEEGGPQQDAPEETG